MSISANYSALKTSLLLDFANTQALDPRVTFSRSTTAPFYDGHTSVLAEQNLLLQSNTFSNAAWVATSATIASNVTDPAGGTTAFSMTATSINATLYQTVTLTATPYTESIYIQRVTGTGTINLTLDGTTLNPVSITGSWVKYSYTATPSAGAKTVGIQIVTLGDAINIYGAQLENRSSATATNITTTSALTNYIPQLQTAPINSPRFDYNPTTGESLGLLIEQSSTNLLTYSQDFTNATWTKSNTTITASANIAPDGTQTAQKLVEDTTASSQHRIYESYVVSTNQTLTLSAYVKPAGRNYCALFILSATPQPQAIFDIVNGTVVSSSNTSATSITPVGNGWFRISISYTQTGSSSTTYSQISLYNTSSSGTYTGDGYSGIYIWGAQLEALAFPTSYIATTSAQVTRALDLAYLLGTNLSSWYNISQGTWIATFIPKSGVGGSPRVVGSNISSKAPLGQSNQAFMYDGSTVQTGNTANLGVTNKSSASWTGTTGSVCLNGGTVVTGTQPNGYANITAVFLGSDNGNAQFINSSIAKIAYYPQALSSTSLQALTGS